MCKQDESKMYESTIYYNHYLGADCNQMMSYTFQFNAFFVSFQFHLISVSCLEPVEPIMMFSIYY